ncbi:MAG: hypothetical protein ACYC08_04195 [Armatimonadota bacterium]
MRVKQLVCFGLLLLAVSAQAEVFTPKTRSVAVFKNGLGFFMRDGVSDLSGGSAVTDLVPPAALGTLWAGSSQKGVKVERLVAYMEDVKEHLPALTVQQMLSANGGKRARLMCGDRIFEGTLISVQAENPSTEVNQVQPYSSRSYAALPATPTLALLRTESGILALDLGRITWVEVLDDPATEYTVTKKVNRMRFEVSGANKKTQVTMGYMQKGITWVPAYMIELLDDKKARITMQGLLANDAEDIDGADVSFVVGYPNFVYADLLSPLSLNQSVTDFINSLRNPQDRNRYNGTAYMMTQNIAMYDYAGARGPAGPAPGFGYTGIETPGEGVEDLYVYRVGDVTLKKGERACYTISSSEVEYETLYEWKVPDYSGIDWRGYYQENRDSAPPPQEQVWHKIRLTNSCKYPWTTASAMVMRDGSPLSQDQLNYTPVAAYGDVKLTVAVDVKAKSQEEEIERKNSAIIINGSSYTKIDKKGTLAMKNFKSVPVKVEVVKTVCGEVTASPDGKTSRPGTVVRAINPVTTITWEVTIQPGEEKTLSYSYFVYAH